MNRSTLRPRLLSLTLGLGLLPAALLPGAPLHPAHAAAQDAEASDDGLPGIEERTEGLQRMDGFLPLHWDEDEGRIYMEIPRFEEEILHYVSLPAGLGENDLGLNRGDLGPRHVVFFRRVGPRVLMVEPNYDYRARSEDAAERRSVEDGFPVSVLWGWPVEAETDGRVLVDLTDFALRDAHGVAESLQRSGEGSWSAEPSRSALHLPRTRAFPRNTEVEAMLTFTARDPGRRVASVTPTAGALTVRQHLSFVELPPAGGFEMRPADPRAGYFGIDFMDFATPLEEPLRQRYIARHRLEKRDPGAAVSEPVEPIVYYLDPGTPEPVRSALLEGASWWNEAFEAAGYRDAFRVEMLPEGADPMDLRYNVIQWVHRSTRGWSYGSTVTDPRTGEILKGHVTLGSLRVRQDLLLFEGLLSPYREGIDGAPEARAAALDRIRQLSAHEVGHTLGLAHNYVSSAQGPEGRASVMDYPHPLVRLTGDGRIDLSSAYDHGVGAWDRVAIRYGYEDFPPGWSEERRAAALDSILTGAMREGITFLSDQDARPVGSAHPRAHLWDNGREAAAELRRMMQVRRAALDRFGEAAIRTGRPLATLEEALVPLYLHHRYQVEGAVKAVGGLYYTYALRGDGQEPLRRVPAEEQWEAVEAVLSTVEPAALAFPEGVLRLIPPRPYGYGRGPELFGRWTGLVFDAVSPAAAAADETLSLLLHPERAARLVQQEALDPSLPGLDEVLGRAVESVFDGADETRYEAEIRRVVERALAGRMMELASGAAMPQVRAVAELSLDRLRARLEDRATGRAARDDDAGLAHASLLAREIARYLERPHEERTSPVPPRTPPGSPIGDPGSTGGR